MSDPNQTVLTTIKEETNKIVTDFLTNVSAYSSIVVVFSIFLISLSVANPVKGAIYIGWVLISTVVRICLLLMVTDGSRAEELPEVCKKGSIPGMLENYDGGRNSIYILCFTFFYVCFPMFISKNVNWYFVWALLVYIAIDCFYKMYNKCFLDISILFGEIIGGSLFGIIISGLMYFLKLTNYLFINNFGSNKEVCSVAGKQTFRCSVYKNGEIISSSTTS